MLNCQIMISRVSYIYIYIYIYIHMAAVTLFRFCRAYGFKLYDPWSSGIPKHSTVSIKTWNNEVANVT